MAANSCMIIYDGYFFIVAIVRYAEGMDGISCIDPQSFEE